MIYEVESRRWIVAWCELFKRELFPWMEHHSGANGEVYLVLQEIVYRNLRRHAQIVRTTIVDTGERKSWAIFSSSHFAVLQLCSLVQLELHVAAPPQSKLQLPVHSEIVHDLAPVHFKLQLPPGQRKSQDSAAVHVTLQLPFGHSRLQFAPSEQVRLHACLSGHAKSQSLPAQVHAPVQGSVLLQPSQIDPVMSPSVRKARIRFVIMCLFSIQQGRAIIGSDFWRQS